MLRNAYRDLRNKIRSFNPEQLLVFIATMSALRLRDPNRFTALMTRHFKHPEVAFPDFFLASVSKLTIEIENKPYYRRGREPTVQTLGQCFNLYLNVDAEQDIDKWSAEELYQYFFRTAFLQFQGGLWQLIPRSLLIHTAYKPDRDTEAFETTQKFQETTGLSLEDFTILGVSLFSIAAASKDGILRPEQLGVMDLPSFREEKVQRFLNIVSADFEDFRTECREKCNPVPGFEHYDFNPLLAKPVVRLSADVLTLPVPRLLIERVTYGIYYDLAERFGDSFLIYLGRAYEHYVGMLLNNVSDVDVRAELEYGPRKRRKRSTDWVMTRAGEAILFECKTKRVRQVSLVPQEIQNFRDDLRKGVVRAVTQLSSTVDDIRAGRLFPELREADLWPFVATLDKSYLFNAEYVRGLVDQELQTAKLPQLDFQVASTEEIEVLTALGEGSKVFDVVRRKFRDPETKGHDLATVLRDAGAQLRHPLLQSTYDKFLHRLGLGGRLRPAQHRQKA